ncbi:hypothetical protein FJ492_20400 [Mesorhizobium sp. B2-5-4]|uniref:hypothetical protein n=1 Tax=unclassified Mesorhizobium TaxID=325217 RepID=UPI0011296C43|nr:MULTISPECIES: hypothetical protein [unclassified Mesorhizobium]TPM02483.1 hypothetical protein FJ960_17935 [Mesorhizobium sp. B2-3-11]TPJ40794.1 hypothetical protein FJ432_15070 [Mesorhizobium sp. B2-6-5]TPJ40823.1 hypothetical protein FJ432_15255 [Mesorhizobium sp. B2-6-5]TPJ83739.1 hypothetical protein FJ434_19415 [Mesorhizobium sp. B2-5-13]TPK41357.1 hypothetical protein FJ492_20400 [Mesorhizobium sp. B2-5-4]
MPIFEGPAPRRDLAPEHSTARWKLPVAVPRPKQRQERITRFCPNTSSPIWHIGGIGDNQVAAK